MYKIGEFSLLNKVTIKTLRYYDEIGLFKPKLVDKFTGYRYYDESQQEEFDKIVKYKNLGFSLEDIIKLKDNVDEEIIRNKYLELKQINNDNDKKMEILKNMIGGDNMINIEFKKYNSEYNNLCVKYDDTFYDRYIILDKMKVYHLGASINHAGSKTFSINILEDEIVKNLLINSINLQK